MSNLLLIIAAAACNSLALTLLKITGDQLRINNALLEVLKVTWIFVLLGMLLYSVSFFLAIKIFSASMFSRAVPMFVGINILSTLLIAVFYFKESLSLSLMLGASLIIIGVWLIQTSSV